MTARCQCSDTRQLQSWCALCACCGSSLLVGNTAPAVDERKESLQMSDCNAMKLSSAIAAPVSWMMQQSLMSIVLLLPQLEVRLGVRRPGSQRTDPKPKN